MDEKIKAIKTSSKVISVIMKIGYVAMIVEMCICLVGLIFIAITGGETSIVTSGGVRIVAVDAPVTTAKGAIAVCVAAFILGAFLFFIFRLAYRMFREINATGTPFNENYVKVIKRIGVLVAVMTVVESAVDSAAAAFAGVDTLGMSSDSTGVIFGVIIYCLAYIFDYGCTLQKLSDETL